MYVYVLYTLQVTKNASLSETAAGPRHGLPSVDKQNKEGIPITKKNPVENSCIPNTPSVHK
jgi:hypothetical protein